VIDGRSTDRTVEIVNRFPHVSRLVSEPDQGIYDAMNKGIGLASGDIIGILNSDDFYVDNQVLEKVEYLFKKKNIESLYADLVYVAPNNLEKVVRYYRASNFSPKLFAYGWMPPHPTFFVRRDIYLKYGLFKTNYKIAADFELLTRFLARYKISYSYLPEVIVKMRTGGVSTRNIRSNFILNQEILRACSENGIKTNIFKVYSKYLTKISQLVLKPA
jgi:glycosyltransferase involved in cell wall biosynthesis